MKEDVGITMLKKKINKVGMIEQINTNPYTSNQLVLLLQALINAGNGRIGIDITWLTQSFLLLKEHIAIFNHHGVATEQ